MPSNIIYFRRQSFLWFPGPLFLFSSRRWTVPMSPNPKQMVPVQDWQKERPSSPANQTWQQTVACLRMIGGRLQRMKKARCQNARTAANHHSHSRWSKEPRRDTSGEPQFFWKLKLSLFQVGSKGLWSLSTHVHYRQLGIRGKLYKS